MTTSMWAEVFVFSIYQFPVKIICSLQKRKIRQGRKFIKENKITLCHKGLNTCHL